MSRRVDQRTRFTVRSPETVEDVLPLTRRPNAPFSEPYEACSAETAVFEMTGYECNPLSCILRDIEALGAFRLARTTSVIKHHAVSSTPRLGFRPREDVHSAV